MVSLLKEEGLEAGLISVGEIAVVGRSPTGQDWAIGLPDHEDAPAEATVHLRDKAVATSSPSGTLFGAEPAGHILDPETGMTASAHWRRVSVIPASAALADGLPTAGVLQSAGLIRAMAARFPETTIRAVDQQGDVLVI